MSANLEFMLKFLGDNTDAKIKSTDLRAALGKDLDTIIAQSKIGSLEIAKAVRTAGETASKETKSATDTVKREAKAASDTVKKETDEIKKSGERDFASFRSAFDKETRTINELARDMGLKLAQHFGISAQGAAQLVNALKFTAIGLTAAGAAVIGAGIGIYSLVKSTTEAAAGLYDMSQRTAFTVETLSAFKTSGAQAGVTLEQIGGSLVRFTNNLADAAGGNEKLEGSFNRMGINVQEALKNPEAALATFIENFAKIPTESEKVIVASEIFGKRTGAALVGVFNQVGGSVDDYKQKLRDLNMLIDGDTAQRADELDDLMTQVGLQFEGVKRIVAEEFMPVVLQALKEFSGWLKENKGTIREWAKSIKESMEGSEKNSQDKNYCRAKSIKESMEGAIWWVKTFKTFWEEAGWMKEGVTQAESDRRYMESRGMPTETKSIGRVDWDKVEAEWREKHPEAFPKETAIDDATGTAEERAAKEAKEAEKRAREAKKREDERLRDLKTASDARLEILRAEADKATRLYRAQMDAAKDAYDRGVANDEQYRDRRIAIEDAYMQKRHEAIAAERAEIEFQEEEMRRRQARDAARDEKASRRKVREYRAQAEKQDEERASKHTAYLRQKEEIEDNARIAKIRDNAERGIITYTEAENQILKIIAGGYTERAKELQKSIAAETQGTARYAELTEEYGILQAKAAAFKEDGERRKRAALQKTADREEDDRRRAVEHAEKIFGDAGKTPGAEIVSSSEMGRQIDEMMNHEAPPVMGKLSVGLQELKAIGTDAFGALSQGFGSMVQSWASGANLGENAGRKMVSSVLAGIAATSAVQAIQFAAYGAVALTPFGAAMFGPASQWFLGAALLGSIALATAVAGRALAPKTVGSSSVAGSTFAAGSANGGGDSQGNREQKFNYNSSTPSSSQAYGEGSRTGSGLVDVLKEVAASNNRVADSHAQVAAAVNYNSQVMRGIDSIPPDQLIRMNREAVGDAMRENYQSYHPVTQDTISLGSTGRT